VNKKTFISCSDYGQASKKPVIKRWENLKNVKMHFYLKIKKKV